MNQGESQAPDDKPPAPDQIGISGILFEFPLAALAQFVFWCVFTQG
jgi:hypothetical protein